LWVFIFTAVIIIVVAFSFLLDSAGVCLRGTSQQLNVSVQKRTKTTPYCAG
jgi:hypothetical protein